MNNIKKQFSDLRSNTPKHIQWMLLAAAFVVVLILLTLLFTGHKKSDVKMIGDDGIELKITPESIDWAKVKVGATETGMIKVSANAPVKVLDVRRTEEVAGLVDKETCKGISQINDSTSCTITLDYTPTAPADRRNVTLTIEWRPLNAPDEMSQTDEVILVLGAIEDTEKKTETKPAPAPAPTPAPVIEPKVEEKTKPVVKEPVITPDADDDADDDSDALGADEYVAPIVAPAKQEIKKEIEAIAPSDPFQSAKTSVSKSDEYTPVPEACSDFAFPGYNSAGRQIGWIKPERGAYYFHPFSDKDCDSPTGVYNPDNGIITDIKNSGKKIGTDAEHIGYGTISAGTMPQLSNPLEKKVVIRASAAPAEGGGTGQGGGSIFSDEDKKIDEDVYIGSSSNYVLSSKAYDRQFILRQFKPIPATIVSDVRADPQALRDNHLPVRATVDRNVYSDDGRNVIIPTGTLMLGYVSGELPGPYTTIGRMGIKWYQFILPNGVEFNFGSGDDAPFSGDSQGRTGVPGRGSTDYLEQFVMPMLTAIVPAAVNMIAPIADTFVNQIDLDNNTVVQSGTLRSSELAKNEIITAWNQVAQKLLVDMMDNTVPPFSIAAGTRITVYSPQDLIVSCGDPNGPNAGKKCALGYAKSGRNDNWSHSTTPSNDNSWVGQVRSFNLSSFCDKDDKGVYKLASNITAANAQELTGYDYRTALFYCQSYNYKAINNARQEQVFENQQSSSNKNSVASMGGYGSQTYNQQVLGLNYDEDTGAIVNPFEKPKAEAPAEEAPSIGCLDGTKPDSNGCCTGEVYTDMGDQGFNCCPEGGGDCFPPIQ